MFEMPAEREEKALIVSERVKSKCWRRSGASGWLDGGSPYTRGCEGYSSRLTPPTFVRISSTEVADSLQSLPVVGVGIEVM